MIRLSLLCCKGLYQKAQECLTLIYKAQDVEWIDIDTGVYSRYIFYNILCKGSIMELFIAVHR